MFYRLKNISSKEKECISFLENHLGKGNKVLVYQLNKNTRIVYSYSSDTKHASISNHKREVAKNEILFVIEKIMKLKNETVSLKKSKNGIVHLNCSLKSKAPTQ